MTKNVAMFDRNALNNRVNDIIQTAMKNGLYFVDLPVQIFCDLFGYTDYGQAKRLRSNLTRDLRKAGYRSETHTHFIRVYTE